MYIVGELINASRKKIATAIGDGDSTYIKEVAADQGKAGADFIDVNATKRRITSSGSLRTSSRSPTSLAPSTARIPKPSKRHWQCIKGPRPWSIPFLWRNIVGTTSCQSCPGPICGWWPSVCPMTECPKRQMNG